MQAPERDGFRQVWIPEALYQQLVEAAADRHNAEALGNDPEAIREALASGPQCVPASQLIEHEVLGVVLELQCVGPCPSGGTCQPVNNGYGGMTCGCA